MGITYFVQGFQAGVQGAGILIIYLVVKEGVCRGTYLDHCAPEQLGMFMISVGIACGMILWYLRTAIEVCFGYCTGATISCTAYCIKFHKELYEVVTGRISGEVELDEDRIVYGLLGATLGGGLVAAILTYFLRKTVWIVGTAFAGAFIVVFACHLALGTELGEGDIYCVGTLWVLGAVTQWYKFIYKKMGGEAGEDTKQLMASE